MKIKKIIELKLGCFDLLHIPLIINNAIFSDLSSIYYKRILSPYKFNSAVDNKNSK